MINPNVTEEDLYAFGIASNVVELLLNSPTINTTQARNLRDAASALEALPESTPDGEWQFGIVYRSSPPTGMHIEFTICDAYFQISRGGSEYYEGTGHDSYAEPDWLVEWDGAQIRDLYLDDLISSVEEFLALGAVSVASARYAGAQTTGSRKSLWSGFGSTDSGVREAKATTLSHPSCSCANLGPVPGDREAPSINDSTTS